MHYSYRYGVFLEYYFKLRFRASWSVHGKALSWENANFKMYPSKINWTSHPLENFEHPDKKLNSLGIILIPWENLNPTEKYQPSPSKKKSQSTSKTSFIVKVSTIQKSLNHHEKASTPTLEIFLISPEIFNPLWKLFNSLEVTSRTPLMRKSQFHLSRNNLKHTRKNLILPENSTPSPSPRKLLNHHWNNLKQWN